MVMERDRLAGSFFGPATFVDLVRHRARHQPDDIAFTFLVDGENEQLHLTNRQLDSRARAIAAWLASSDLSGERALLLYPAGLDFICAFFGCLYAGVVAVPAYPPRRNRSLARIQAIADDADAKVALTTDSVLDRVRSLIDDTPRLKTLNWLSSCQIPEQIKSRWEQPDLDGDTLAFLQYTSGSTGVPKGVMLNHGNLLHNSAIISHAFEHSRSSSGVFWLPSYHDMGLIGGILQPMFIGRPNIIMTPMAFLQKPFRWLSAISRFGATTSGGPNFAYDLCVRKIDVQQRKSLDLSSWRIAFNGAEPIRPETLDRFVEAFGPCGFRREAFYPCFGLAEATLIVSGGYAKHAPIARGFQSAALADRKAIGGDSDDDAVRTLIGCGHKVPDQEIVIVDPDSLTRCKPGQIGEIWISGPSVARGYWRNAEATEETFRARLEDTGEGPFLRTGDLGFLDDGELFVAGRIKDLIILHGVNVYPQDIEHTVQNSHHRLRTDAGAAFSVDSDGRERLVIVQELRRGKKTDCRPVFDALLRAVSAEHEMGVDAVVLVRYGSISRTSSGKIQRHACRAAYLDGSLKVVDQWRADADSDRSAAEENNRDCVAVPAAANGTAKTAGPQSVADLVLAEVRRVARGRTDGLTLDSPITEIGLDSLERMEILASIEERFGGRFPEEVLHEMESCRQVVEATEKYLGTKPRSKPLRLADAEIPEDCYRFDKLPEYLELKQSLDMLDATGLRNPYFNVHQGATSDRTVIDGRELINFSSFNYLGMSSDPAVILAVQEATGKYGASVSASRLVSGEKDLHGRLEKTIARFLGTEDAITFVSGHSTNETVIGHLLGPADLILHDALSHNSIVQGSLLSGARRRPFPHNDWQAVDQLLRQYRHEYRRVLLVIEGVYSMDGDVPDLPKFIELKKRHKTYLMIDEAHSVGTLGKNGRGIGEHFDVKREDVDIWMGTLSKALGSCGGYIAGCGPLIEYLKYTAPGFVFSVGISPAAVAGALAALELLEAEPQRAVQLQERSRLFLRLSKENGLNTGLSHGSPVVPVILGSSMRGLKLSKAMFDRGVNVQPILYPAVPESAARLRFFITSLHTEEQIRYTVKATVEEMQKIDSPTIAPIIPGLTLPIDALRSA